MACPFSTGGGGGWMIVGGVRLIPTFEGVGELLDTILCDKVCQWPVVGLLFPPRALVSSNNKTDHHSITEILLKVTLNT